MSSDTAPAPSRRARTGLLITLSAVLVLAAAYVVLALLSARTAPSGSVVADVEIGGLSEEEAQQRLTDELGSRAAAPLELLSTGGAAEDARAELDPAESGIAFDAQATVDPAIGLSFDPRLLWDRWFGEHDYAPVITFDDDSAGPVLEELADDLSEEPEDAELSFEGTDTVVEDGEDGALTTPEDIREAITAQWLRSDAPVEIAPETVEPQITTAEARRAESEVARPAVSEDVEVEAAEQTPEGEPSGESSTIVITPEVIAETLSFEAAGRTLEPVFDAEALRERALADNPEVGVPAVDATFRVVDGAPTVVPSSNGISVDPDDLAAAVVPALTSPDRTAQVTLQEAEPEFTTADAEAVSVDEVISEFSTAYGSEPNRDTNLRVAAESVSGTVLLPGEQFSLNETLGERTAANGYRPAGVISGGQMKVDYGGGVSQISTTLFNAAFFAGLQLDEHQAHSRYISRYPEGRETTLDWHSIDLRFTNDSSTPVVLDMYMADGHVHARVFGVKTVDVEADASSRFAFTSPSTIRESGPGCSPQSPREGWSITITRTIRDHGTGKVVARDEFTTTYRPVNHVICGE